MPKRHQSMNMSTGSLSTGATRLGQGDTVQIEGEGKSRHVTHVMGSERNGWHACFARQGSVPQGKVRWRVVREATPVEGEATAKERTQWTSIRVPSGLRSERRVIITGFDAAWTRLSTGGLASFAIDDAGVRALVEPTAVGFVEAAELIEHAERAAGPASMHIIVVDQPLIVRNQRGLRPVERVLSRIMGRAGGGVQPANRSRREMFGDDAPIWDFLDGLGGTVDPWAVHRGAGGRIIIEGYPALAALGLFPELLARNRAPKYNPDRRTFSIDDWRALCFSLAAVFRRLNLKTGARWCVDAAQRSPRKSDQDLLDALICVLIGLVWWATPESVLIAGDLEHGYVLSPAHEELRRAIVEGGSSDDVPVSVGPVRPSSASVGTPSAVLAAVEAPSDASGDDVDVLVRRIAEGKRPARFESVVR